MAKQNSVVTTVLFTLLALVCFAANSILCRLALSSHSIDPATFTAIRLTSGALILGLLVLAPGKKAGKAGNWISGLMLFVYAIAFSFAYIKLSAGTGALLLFGSVQATMIIGSMIVKKHPTPFQWVGLFLAIGGLVYLVFPGLSAPDPFRAALMAIAGIGWGIYSLRGAGGSDPVSATAGNFLRAMPLAAVPLGVYMQTLKFNPHGFALAVVSGAVTSGLGYVFWYTALPGLGSIRASVVQLTVPILVAVSGVLLLHEHLTQRLEISAAIILSGVALALFSSRRK